uniref:sphingomyelin phosphodiesterase n=1 Tax=Arcella intermedia TaxID=1963864 RepID=A0A6B2L9E7_9EUKA
MTYNIFLRPPFVKNNESDFKEERFNLFLEKLNNYSVVALQELFSLGNTRQQRLISYAKDHGFPYHLKSIPPPLLSRKFIDAGLLILSRYPIIRSGGHIFTSGNQIDFYAAKQILYAQIAFPPAGGPPGRAEGGAEGGPRLHLFTLHLQASYYDNDAATNVFNDQSRDDQVSELVQFVQETLSKEAFREEDLCLVAGDFNVNSRKTSDGVAETMEYKRMVGIFKTHFDEGQYVFKDSLMDNYGYHPVTYGDVEQKEGIETPKETVLTDSVDLFCKLSIDYIFSIQKQPGLDASRSAGGKGKKLSIENALIEEFLCKSAHVTQLSDHYGISADFVFS